MHQVNTTKEIESGQALNVGVVARGARSMTIMQTLNSFKPSSMRMKLVAIAAVTKSAACYKYAGEMDIEIVDDYMDLLSIENLDLILELTGDQQILNSLVQHKPPSIGILDSQASRLFFDELNLYEQVARKETEISLATSFASALLEASPDGVMVIDRDYRIINCNDSPLITGGKKRGSILGKFCFNVIQGASIPCTRHKGICTAQDTLETGQPQRTTHESLGPTGESQLTQVTTYPISNELGEIVQIVVTVRDMTKALAERIEQRTRAIKDDLARFVQEDRLASLGRLVASVCHEINNPIASIVTFNKLILSYIRAGTLPEKGLKDFDRYLDLSVSEALRCGDIVKTLLTFARQKSVEAKEIDMIKVVDTIMLLTSHQLELAEVDYAVNMPKAPFQAWGDHAQIQQSLMNLVFNAIDSMPNGGKLTINGGVNRAKDMVWLTVGDTGQGIEAKDLSRIFEPFYSTKTDGKGVGLGLSMVYGIIREHNGFIVVDSKPGVGTVFKIKLPSCQPGE
jgi:two-component system NtrC family sensor kinase